MTFFRPALIVGALPVTLLNGTTADATQVMSDLNFIVNQVNANAAPLANTALTNANNNFTTVQSGQAATQPANFVIASQIENNSLQTLSSVLGTNSITARIAAIPLGAYVSGQVFTFFPAQQNSGATTINVDGLGAKSILNMGSALSGAELPTNRPAVIGFDGAANAFDLVNGTPYVQGPNLPSAATLNLDGSFGDYHQVDGTTNITALTLSRGRQALLEFNSSLLITNSATLVLGTHLATNPGDAAVFRGEAASVVRLVSFFRKSPPSAIVLSTEVSASGANFILPVPPGAKRVTVMINGLSTNGTSNLVIQLGGGAVENTGYTGAIFNTTSANATATTFFLISNVVGATDVYQGIITFNLENQSNNTWAMSGILSNSTTPALNIFAGVKATSGMLTKILIGTLNGTDVFDAGLVNISTELG